MFAKIMYSISVMLLLLVISAALNFSLSAYLLGYDSALYDAALFFLFALFGAAIFD